MEYGTNMGILITAVGIFMLVSGLAKSNFIIYWLMVARSKMLWDENEQVVEIMTLAFDGKFQSLVPMPREEMPQFLTETGVIYSPPFPSYIVAEVDSEVAGVLALKWTGQKRPPEEHHIRRPASKYGWGECSNCSLGFGFSNTNQNLGNVTSNTSR